METTVKNELQYIDNWISFMYLFTRKVKNYSIQNVFKEVTEKYRFSKTFENEGKNADYHFNQFRTWLFETLSDSKNSNIILKNIKNRVEPTIRKYKEWYKINKTNTEIFEPYNPYKLMFEYMVFTEKEIELYLPQRKTATKEKRIFESIFRDTDNARKIKERFELKGYTINGRWQGLTDDKSELLCAYYVLKPLLKPGLKIAPTVKIFYSEFGLSENHITDRMMTIEPFNGIRDEFEVVFSDLLQSKIKK